MFATLAPSIRGEGKNDRPPFYKLYITYIFKLGCHRLYIHVNCNVSKKHGLDMVSCAPCLMNLCTLLTLHSIFLCAYPSILHHCLFTFDFLHLHTCATTPLSTRFLLMTMWHSRHECKPRNIDFIHMAASQP
jgi:hypothetical protein